MATIADKPISFQPTPGLSYDPSEARYWEPAALDGEVRRAFEICHSLPDVLQVLRLLPHALRLPRPQGRGRREAPG